MNAGMFLLKYKKHVKTMFPAAAKIWQKRRRYYVLNNLDKKLRKYIKEDNGFFIEIGANDGLSQSNTLWLEKKMGWRGILIEAVPSLSDKCRINRPKSRVFNCACVAEDYNEKTIKIIYANLMSIVAGHKTKQEEVSFLDSAKEHCEEQFYLEVPARTMSSILDECNVKSIDFLCLDVEGYELNVLKGLDLDRHSPSFILIEAEDRKPFDEYLKGRYNCVDKLSEHDYLYEHI